MEGVIIQDYFGSNNDQQKNDQNNNDKPDNNDKEEKLEIIDIEENLNIDKESLPSDMEIVRTEKSSKSVIPEEIILDKQNSNELTQKMVEKTNNIKMNLN